MPFNGQTWLCRQCVCAACDSTGLFFEVCPSKNSLLVQTVRLCTCDATSLCSGEACPSTDKHGCADNASVQRVTLQVYSLKYVLQRTACLCRRCVYAHVMLQAYASVKHGLLRANSLVQTMRLCSMCAICLCSGEACPSTDKPARADNAFT